VAAEAGRILALHVMARRTALDVAPRELAVPAAAGADPARDRAPVGPAVPQRPGLGDSALSLMALGAEGGGLVTGLAVLLLAAASLLCVYA